jgi:TatA/E family protein of Tat protein translocase
MPGGLSIWELLIVFAVLLLLFGAKRLPEMGKSLGHGMREFKDAVTGTKVDVDEQPKQQVQAQATTPAPAPPPAPPAAAPAPPPAQPPADTEHVSS